MEHGNSVFGIPYSISVFIFHYCLSLFLTSITIFLLSAFILIKNSQNTVNRLFGLFMACVAVWGFTQALIGTLPPASAWLLIAQIEHLAHVFIPTLFLHFVFSLTRFRSKGRLLTSYVISVILFCLVPTKLLVSDIDQTRFAKFVINPGPLYPAYCAWFIGTILEALFKLRRAIVSLAHRPLDQLKLKYVFWSTTIGYIGGLPNFLYVFGIDVYPLNPFGTYLVPIFPILFTYSIVKHQVLDVRIVIRKSLVYSILVSVMTAVYLSFVLLAEKLLQGIMGYRSLIGSIGAGFAIALSFNPLREVVQQFVDRCFFYGSQLALAEENKRLRQRLAGSEKLKAVAALAAGMAHEIKNPLSSIKTFAEHLPQKYEDPLFREKFARIISQEVGKINQLVQRLLEFAKPAPPQRCPIRLSNLIDETIELLHGPLAQKRIEVVRAYTQRDAVFVDPTQMKQVFLNLLLNSIEAATRPSCVAVTTVAENGHLEVQLADCGPGISPKDLPHVFDPFYTTKPQGTGLGLSVVHSIVREHGGRITLDSQVGRGTTVRIRLPLNGGANGANTHPDRG